MAFTASTTISRLFSLSPKPPSSSSFPLSSLKGIGFGFRAGSGSNGFSITTRKDPSQFKAQNNRFSSFTITSSISPGSTLPNSTFSYMDPTNEVQTLTTADITSSKTTILFAVPGAFTPTCSQKHVPSFISKYSELKSKGVDVIACVSVNDVFVMKAWKESLGVPDDVEIMFLSDGNCEFTKAIGAELDLSDKPVGLGVRSRRYAMLVKDGVVKVVNMEDGGAFTFSGADDMLSLL